MSNETNDMIDIKGLDKAKVLRALFNASKQQGLGFLDGTGAGLLTLEASQKIIDDRKAQSQYFRDAPLKFDYLRGRVLKVNIQGDTLDPRLYDRDNGEGAAARALAHLRAPE